MLEVYLIHYRRRIISIGFTEDERTRFRNLLELANSSKFAGERANALAAATRLAGKYSMNLEEAASSATNPQPISVETRRRATAADYHAPPESAMASNIHDISGLDRVRWRQGNHEVDKQRWQDAVNQAKSRGLDGGGGKKGGADSLRPRRASRSRRNPLKHVEILLKETSFSIKEIADITRLNIYAVVEIKLKMRKAA